MNRIDPGKARLRSALGGHRGGVFSVAFGPAGAVLAAACGDGTVKLWDAATGDLITTLAEHERLVLAMAFDPAGALLVTAGHEETVRLWGLEVWGLEG